MFCAPLGVCLRRSSVEGGSCQRGVDAVLVGLSLVGAVVGGDVLEGAGLRRRPSEGREGGLCAAFRGAIGIGVDTLDSQTKCGTCLGCCHGTALHPPYD